MKEFRDARVDSSKVGVGARKSPQLNWKDAEKLLVEGLGAERVSLEEVGVTLSFNLADHEQQEQAARLKIGAAQNNITCFEVGEGDTILKVFIPREENLKGVMAIAQQLAVRVTQKATGEIQKPILPGDPESILEQLTKRRWKTVTGSAYEEDTVEPIADAVPDPLRAHREYGVAYALKPQGGTDLRMKEWLEHQRNVETKGNVAPRTALPKSWVSELGVQNARDFLQTKPKAANFSALFGATEEDKPIGKGPAVERY